MNRTRLALAAAAALVLAVAAGMVWRYERILAHGAVVRLELAPVDPRSLLQGDYMDLDYALNRDLPISNRWHAPVVRTARLHVDAERRATRVTAPAPTTPAGADEVDVTLRHARFGRQTLAPTAFFFQQGTAQRLEDARWGELRVAPDGTALLVRLLDERLQPLGTQQF